MALVKTKAWFGPKTHGFGISPTSTAGWIAVALFVLAAMVVPPALTSMGAPPWATVLGMMGLTVAFLILVAVKSRRDQ